MGYLFLLLTNLCGITKVVCMKKCGRLFPGEDNSIRINSVRALICACVSVIIFLFAGAKASWTNSYIWVISGISNAGLLFFWLLCSERASLIYVETFGLFGSVVIPLFLAPVLYEGESVNVFQWIGIACLLLAVVALSVKPANKAKNADLAAEGEQAATRDTPEKRFKSDLTTVICLIFLILSNAGVQVTQKSFVKKIGGDYLPFFNLMTFCTVLLCFVAASLIRGVIKRRSGKEATNPESLGKKGLLLVFLAAVAIYAFQYFGSLASGKMDSAVYYPLVSGISIILTVLGDVVIFRQKLNKNMIIAFVLVLFTIVLTNIKI